MTYNILVTGASIAGPALAYWLNRYGMKVTVLERAAEFRDGGQTIDVRDVGRVVAERMGLLETIRERGTNEEALAFVNADNEPQATFEAGQFGGDGPVAELEILRGELARVLIDRTRPGVEYIFGDHITAVADTGEQVVVTLASGGTHEYDLLIIAEGLRSSTRDLLFADDVEIDPYDLYMGYFTIPRGPTDTTTARWFNAPGGRSILVRPDNVGTTRVVLTVQTEPEGHEDQSQDALKAWLAERFADAGWETPRILEGLAAAEDFYFESISQVKMQRWATGRVAVVGDAAYCASPISGKGTNLALVGAYVLAGELARQAEYGAAFANYERIMRPYVEQSQDVPKIGPRIAQPQTRFGIVLQQLALKVATSSLATTIVSKVGSSTADAIDLPDYDTLIPQTASGD